MESDKFEVCVDNAVVKNEIGGNYGVCRRWDAYSVSECLIR